MALKCTNTSSPPSTWMKPYPFASLNHLTVPCAIRLFPLSWAGMDRPLGPAPPWLGFPPGSGGNKKSATEDRGPHRRYRSLEPIFVHVREKQRFMVLKSRAG